MSTVEITRKDQGTVLAEERTDLALRALSIAGERTLMAWIRTVLSMIGFGFTIYNFFRYLPEEIANGTDAPAGPAQSGDEPYCSRYCDIDRRSLAAPAFFA